MKGSCYPWRGENDNEKKGQKGYDGYLLGKKETEHEIKVEEKD